MTIESLYGGKNIVLDGHIQSVFNTQLMAKILLLQPIDQERIAWSRFSSASLANAYGDDEPEYITTG